MNIELDAYKYGGLSIGLGCQQIVSLSRHSPSRSSIQPTLAKSSLHHIAEAQDTEELLAVGRITALHCCGVPAVPTPCAAQRGTACISAGACIPALQPPHLYSFHLGAL